MQYIHEGTKFPIKMWTDHVPVDQASIDQLKNIANMPFIHKHVAVMPDVHYGIGATVGSVIATKGAIIPAAVGVDIGCGMMAVRLNLTANDLPEDLSAMRSDIEAAVPHGRTNNGGSGDRGAWGDVPEVVGRLWSDMRDKYGWITKEHPGAHSKNTANHLGTLGGGNHFVEVCLDEDNDVWVMLHSGSRGLGNRIGQYFIEKAKEEMKRYFINLPDQDLSYLVEGSSLFDDYCYAVEFAQEFAAKNRAIMLTSTLTAMQKSTTKPIWMVEDAVNCHHNYISKEFHQGSNVFVTRKGAVRARTTDLGIIPGSMGAKSFIVRGLGNEQSFCSCSHGAGRVMSRNQAKKEVSLEQHLKDTAGVECRKDIDVIDETPSAYKNIEDVMRSQSDLVEVVHTLKQILCVKG
jgi:tRNA-splicing ligase RtcB (3'-phosphate/5'-hydroxy nucleic acid ligase)